MESFGRENLVSPLDPQDFQDYFKTLCGTRSVPKVFFAGKFIGGGDETVALAQSGQLAAMAQAAGLGNAAKAGGGDSGSGGGNDGAKAAGQPEQQPKHFTASEGVSAPTASPTCALVAVPESRQAVAAWLFATAGCLFGMIVIGGYTRLSGSGLSMTKWKFQGTLLPPTKEAWEAEFAAYRKTPEYQKLHAGTMDLPHFQRIYFVEWFHRMWGRMTGLVFGVPLLVFLSRAEVFKFAKTKSSFATTFLSKKCPLTPRLGLQLTGLLALGISQAVVGWWMVRSGFVDPKEHMPHSDNPAVLVAITIVSGAFVAGNDAGLDYNTWPKMLDHWVPPKVTAGYAAVKIHAPLIPKDAFVWAGYALPAAVFGQICLGITTLLHCVPVELGVAHQAGGVGVLSVLITLLAKL
eukprot:g10549.t1